MKKLCELIISPSCTDFSLQDQVLKCSLDKYNQCLYIVLLQRKILYFMHTKIVQSKKFSFYIAYSYFSLKKMKKEHENTSEWMETREKYSKLLKDLSDLFGIQVSLKDVTGIHYLCLHVEYLRNYEHHSS